MPAHTTRSTTKFTLRDPDPVQEVEILDGDDEDEDDAMTMDNEVQDEEMQGIEGQDGEWQDDVGENFRSRIEESRDDFDLPSETDRLIVAIDFGTTFSSVAYTRIRKGQLPSNLGAHDIKCVNQYPDYRPPTDYIPLLGSQQLREDVPTELWYDPEPQSRILLDEPHAEQIDEIIDDNQSDSSYQSSDEDGLLEEQDEPSSEHEDQDRRYSKPQICYWGFGVQNQLEKLDVPKDNERRVARFKLLLDKSESTEKVRKYLDPIIRKLKQKKMIKDATDTITHYMTHLLENAKDQLTAQGELREDCAIEFVLCVPAKWPTRGSRVMQAALKQAVENAGFHENAKIGVENLFIVSEPEAAATWVLSEHNDDVHFGEVVTILDAGGGTVDAVTYEVTNEEPIRMQSEVVEPDSKLCGASYINENFEKLLTKKLANELYLEVNGKTIKSIIEAQSIRFENGEKRRIDTNDPNCRMRPVYIDNLKANPQKGLYQNRVEISHKELKEEVFRKPLRRTKALLKSQLQLAVEKEMSVVKVILTGGFGQSVALQNCLKRFLSTQRNYGGTKIELLISRTPSTAVAKGAIWRALRKDQGPERISQCSYGFLSTEPYEPEIYEAHAKVKCRVDPSDGERYVNNTIHWLIKKNDRVPNRKEFVIDVKHTFSLNRQKFICREELYVSDKRHESHYRKSHVNNKAAELAGSIVADMTFLKTEGLIKPEEPSESSKWSNIPTKRYWAVHFELVLIVEGRNLRYEARWPLTEDLRAGQRQGVHAKGQVSIAAAFQPGTA